MIKSKMNIIYDAKRLKAKQIVIRRPAHALMNWSHNRCQTIAQAQMKLGC